MALHGVYGGLLRAAGAAQDRLRIFEWYGVPSVVLCRGERGEAAEEGTRLFRPAIYITQSPQSETFRIALGTINLHQYHSSTSFLVTTPSTHCSQLLCVTRRDLHQD